MTFLLYHHSPLLAGQYSHSQMIRQCPCRQPYREFLAERRGDLSLELRPRAAQQIPTRLEASRKFLQDSRIIFRRKRKPVAARDHPPIAACRPAGGNEPG